MRSLRLVQAQQSTRRLKSQTLWKLGGLLLLAFVVSIPLQGSFITDVMLCSATMPAPIEGGKIKITLSNMLYHQDRDKKSATPETSLPLSPFMPNDASEPQLEKGGALAGSFERLRLILAAGVLLTLTLVFVSSFMPTLSGAHAKPRTAAQKRDAANLHKRRLKRTPECVTADMPLSTTATSKESAPQAQVMTAPRAKKHARSFQQLEDLEDVINLHDSTAPREHDYPILETSDMPSESAAQAVWPAPSLQVKKEVKAFFTQSQFQFTEVTPTIALVRSKALPYEQYGDIPVAMLTKTTFNEATAQAVYHAVTTQGRVSEPTLILAILDELPHYSAYQRICQYAAERNATLLPISLRLLEKAIRNGNCPQTLEKMIVPASSRNVYETGGSVENPLEFFGREKMIATLLDSMSHLQHIGLFGPRKIGKTSLIWQLREQMAQHIVAYIDLQHVPRDCSYLYQIILDECVRDASFKYPEIKLPAFERPKGAILPNYSTQFIQHLVRVWETLKTYRHDIKIVLLLDEAEHFVPNSTEDEEGFSGFHEFMAVVRGVSQQYGFLVSIIVSSRPEISRIDTYRGQSNPGFHYYKEVFLSSLAETGCNQMIQNLGAQMGMSYNEEALSRIYYETGGHPYVTRQFCSLLAQRDRNSTDECCTPDSGKIVEVQDIEQAISDYLDQKSDYLDSIWQRLSYIEQEILLILTTHHNSCALEDIIANDLGYDAKRQRRKAVSNLIEHEIIEKCENKYSIRMGLFERFLQASN